MKKLLKQLVIDTATKYIYLSLIIGGIEKQFVYEEGINNHSVTIIPFIENILKKEGLKLPDLNQVIIGIGPGSYTGVRIGVTVAKMIGYLNNLEVYTVSSLALIASHSNKPYVLALIDARRGNAFMGLYRNVDDKLERISEDVLDNIENHQNNINFDFDVIEDGKPQIEKILNSNLMVKVEDIHNLTPNYLRITEAERNLRNENDN
jgi:tRNA threonylcarbamoyladenosine biosynthesis protein TsaB